MIQSNHLQATEKSPSDIYFQRKFWGAIAISVMALLAYSYVLSNLFRLEPTTAVYIKMAVYIIAIVLSITSFILAIRRQVDLALTVIFYYLLIALVAGPATTQGRTLNSTFTMLVIGILMIGWLLPRLAWRRNAAYLAGAFVLAWVFEWIDPPWRIVTGAAVVGPIVAIIFSIILVVLLVRESWGTVSRNLRVKITVWTGAIVLVLSTILVIYSALSARQTAIQTAESDVLQHAEAHASIVRAELESPMDTARTMSQTLTVVKENDANVLPFSRSQVNAMLRQVLIENPGFLGTYTLWEPNAFDGVDDSYRNTENSDETGRFIPYWIRGDDGSISVIPLEQYETPGIGDWYILPRQNKREMTFAPLIYPINGVDTVMASFIVPIISRDKFYGIAGVDAPIAFVQELVDSVDLYDSTADAILVTSSGTLIGVRNRPDLVNQPATEIYPDFAELQAQIEAGEPFISLSPDGNYLRAFAPVNIGKTGTHWVFGLTIPFSKVTTEATTGALVQAGINTALIALALLLLWFLTGQVVRPLQALTNVANAVAEGNLDRRAEVTSTDEVGTLATTFNAMTSQLQETLQGLEQRVAERTQDLELAAKVGHSVSQVRALDVMLKNACELILEQFDLYYVQVYLVNQTQTELQLQAGTGEVGAQLLERRFSLPLNTNSLNGRAAVERRPVVIPDTSESTTFRKNPLLLETRGEMAVPLIVGERVVGVLDMQTRYPGKLTDEVLPAFEALAGQLAVAIQNANLLAEAEQARADVEAQARRLARTSWSEHLDAIHKPEQIGFMFHKNEVVPIKETGVSQIEEDNQEISSPIYISGEPLGSLVVEVDDEERKEQTSELVAIVARQVAQQIENLRLLESAERFRQEAEEASRRQTAEGWQAYVASRTKESLGYIYDLNEVRPYSGGQDDATALTLPLKVRDEAIGKMAIQGLSPNDRESFELVNAVAERLSAHIESLRQYDQTQSALSQSEKLFNASRRLTESAGLQELVVAVVETLNIPVINRAVLGVFDYGDNDEFLDMTIVANWWNGLGHEATPIGTRYPVEVFKTVSLFASTTPVFFNDAFHDPRADETTLALAKRQNLRAVAVLPLFSGVHQVGVLMLEAEEPHSFRSEETRLFSSLAPQIATVLENRRQFERAQKQAEREGLLNTISQKIQSATSVEAVLQIAARELGHALGAPMTIAQLSLKDQD